MSIAHPLAISAPHSSDEIDRTYRKVAFRIVPLIIVAYVVSYIDRVNVGFAKLQFLKELDFSEAIYGLGAGLFFAGYALFEVPSNLYLEKIGARLTLSRIMILWGLISAGMAFVSSPMQFYVMRFALGAAEAGFFPGIILYLSYWFPASRRGRITSLFTMGAPVAGMIGSPLSGWLMTFDGLHGLRGWQVLLIYEGLPAVLLGLFVLMYMADRPDDANWLTERERDLITHNLSVERAAKGTDQHGDLKRSFRDPILYVFAIAYIGGVAGTSTVSLWSPSIIKGLGVGTAYVGILTALPFVVALLSMYLLALSSDRMLERRWHYAIAISVAGASLALLSLGSDSLVLTLVLLSIAAAGAAAQVPIFWTMPATYLSGTGKAAGIGFISSVGAFGGFISPTIVGWAATKTGSLYYGLAVVGAMMITGSIVLLVFVRKRLLTETRAH